MTRFFTGLHNVKDAQNFDAAFISRNRLRTRKAPFVVGDWIMDSAAFSTILTHGGYPDPVDEYAEQIRRWSKNGNLLAAVAQDYMCEPHMLAITGMTVEQHQRLTIERYDALMACDTGGVYIMPVIQGYSPQEYAYHVQLYGDRIKSDAWVGVGSVCKRNANPDLVAAVLIAIKRIRPQWKLHGFGIKKTALANSLVSHLLHTADSMAWSFNARKNGRNGNDWREAKVWTESINAQQRQEILFV